MSHDTLRDEVRQWLAARWTPGRSLRISMSNTSPEGREWLRQVFEGGWSAPGWPVEWFGRGLGREAAAVVAAEFARAGAPGSGQDRSNLPANTLLAHGSDALRREFIPRLLRGEINMCLLYSEPGAGSDLASVRTTAVPRGDGFVVNGQKVWTSGGHTAEYGMMLARTDWDAPKHKGLSFFFLPLGQPGVEVRPLRQITGESHFNEVFITDAFVPARLLVGDLNDGWRVLQTALAYERSVMGDHARRSRHGAADDLVMLADRYGRLRDPVLRQDLAKVLSYRVLNQLNLARAKAEAGTATASPLMSLGKLAMSRILHEEARIRTEIIGAESLLAGPAAPVADDVNFLALNAYFTSIGGGTDQIQRNIIGERVLGLPKEPEVDRTIPFRQVLTS